MQITLRANTLVLRDIIAAVSKHVMSLPADKLKSLEEDAGALDEYVSNMVKTLLDVKSIAEVAVIDG